MVTTLGPTLLMTGAKLVRASTSRLSGSFSNLICGSDEAPPLAIGIHPNKIRINAPKVHSDPLTAPVFFITFPREFPRLSTVLPLPSRHSAPVPRQCDRDITPSAEKQGESAQVTNLS